MFSNTYLNQNEVARYFSYKEKQLFLWPVFTWEIYTSSPNGRSLNVFEKSILELIRVTGNRSLDAETISQWLGLDLDMINYILSATLIPNGWLDKSFKITVEGCKLLDDETHADVSSASIYQCAITGRWLPRITYKTNEKEPVNEQGFPKFRLDRSTDRTLTGYKVRNLITNAESPDESKIKHIVSQNNDATWIALNTRDDIDIALNKIDMVQLSKRPVSNVYLMVWGDFSSGLKFNFSDPFGLSTKSDWMNELFNEACKMHSSLGDFALSKLTSEDNELNYSETILAMKDKAEMTVLVEYPKAMTIDGLTEALYDLFSDKEKLMVPENVDFNLNKRVINDCGSIIEIVCKSILNKFPYKYRNRLPAQSENNFNKKKKLSALLKDSISLSEKQINDVLTVQAGKIYQTAIGRNSSLRSLLALIFISMGDYPHHPMNFLLENPLLFDDVYRLSHKRDEAAHGSSIRFNLDEALYFYKVVEKFLNKLLME